MKRTTWKFYIIYNNHHSERTELTFTKEVTHKTALAKLNRLMIPSLVPISINTLNAPLKK